MNMSHFTGKMLSAVLVAVAMTSAVYGAEQTFNNATADGSIQNAGNWTPDGLPTTGTHTGIVPDNFATKFANRFIGDLTIEFQGNSTLRNGTAMATRLHNSHLTFKDTTAWINQNGTGKENLIIGYNDDSTLTWNSSGALTQIIDLNVGKTGYKGILTQTAGTITANKLNIIQNGSVYNISDGTMNVTVNTAIIFTPSGTGTQPHINFTTGSTGSIIVNGDAQTSLAGQITAGNIRINGAVAATTDFDVTYDSVNTTIKLLPAGQPTPTVASLYGEPTPAVGTHTYTPGTEVTASVAQIVTNINETIVECIGWTGSGDIPSSGTSNTVTATISDVSSITWMWKTNEVYLAIATGSGVSTDVSSGFVPSGTNITVTATPAAAIWYGETNSCIIAASVITCPMPAPRSIGTAIPGSTIYWDAGGADDLWTTGLNWDNDFTPLAGFSYVVNNATIESPGGVDLADPVTYTFAGDSLSVTNNSNLFLYKYNKGGTDDVYLNIANLTVKDSRIEVKCNYNYYLRLNNNLHLEGGCDILISTGLYKRHFYLLGGMTGSGTLQLHREGNGSEHRLYLDSGDFSGYSGDWSVDNDTGTVNLELMVNTTTGWGTGDMTLGHVGYLSLGADVNASSSALTMSTNSTLALVNGTASTVDRLTVDGSTLVHAGTYTATELSALATLSQFTGDTGTLTVLSPATGSLMLIK